MCRLLRYVMTYPGQVLIHDSLFDLDCERVFGSLEIADEELAAISFDIAHDIAIGAQLAAGVMAYFVPGDYPCVLIVEYSRDQVLLRACVAIGIHEGPPKVPEKRKSWPSRAA
jgi:hypothetical protein